MKDITYYGSFKEHIKNHVELKQAVGYKYIAEAEHLKRFGLPEHEIKELKSVGLLHDIGKIAINENILNKPGKLTDDEWKEIKLHPEIGYRILSTFNDMSDMANYVLYHHERWDGKGYPKEALCQKKLH